MSGDGGSSKDAREERKKRVLQQIRSEVEQVSEEWNVTAYLSGGSYGEVCGAVDKRSGQRVAIKRVYKAKVGRDEEVVILNEPFLAKRVYREIKLLSHFHHDNILGLVTVLRLPAAPEQLEKVYMVMECMDTDLSQIIRDPRAKITDEHIQYFMFQIFHGLKCLHDAGVIHRDLHPGNVLLNAENDIKICDFNLAKEDGDGASTDYVTYRWYRAPELVMQWKNYDKKIDMWSVGCMFGELHNRKPMFPGTTFYNQLNKIIEVIGTPHADDIKHIGSQSAKQYMARELSGIAPRPWEQIIATQNALALDLLSKLLVFSPARRIDVDTALRHDYFKYPNCLFDEEEMAGVTRMERFHFDESLKEAAAIRAVLADDIAALQMRHQAEVAEAGGEVSGAPADAAAQDAGAGAGAGDDGADTTSPNSKARRDRGDGIDFQPVQKGGMVRTNSDYNIDMIDKMMREQEGLDEGAGGDADPPPDSTDATDG